MGSYRKLYRKGYDRKSATKNMLQKIRETKTYDHLVSITSVMAQKRIDVYSACAAFYIYMSFIPFVLILLSLIRYLPFSKQDLLMIIDLILPADTDAVVIRIIDELYARGIGTLSISVAAAVWASGKGVLGIAKGLNEINDCKYNRSFLYVRAKSAICTMLLVLCMIMMLIISVLGNTITGIIKRMIDIPPYVAGILELVNVFVFFFLFIVFMFLFCVLPDRKMSIRSQIPGAAGAALVWMLFTKLFSFYLSTFDGYSMYGTFAIVIVTGVWLYFGMYIMFMGALSNKLIASRKGRDHEGKDQ